MRELEFSLLADSTILRGRGRKGRKERRKERGREGGREGERKGTRNKTWTHSYMCTFKLYNNYAHVFPSEVQFVSPIF